MPDGLDELNGRTWLAGRDPVKQRPQVVTTPASQAAAESPEVPATPKTRATRRAKPKKKKADKRVVVYLSEDHLGWLWEEQRRQRGRSASVSEVLRHLVEEKMDV